MKHLSEVMHMQIPFYNDVIIKGSFDQVYFLIAWRISTPFFYLLSLYLTFYY